MAHIATTLATLGLGLLPVIYCAGRILINTQENQ